MTKDSNQITREYFDSLLLEMRHIDSDIPSTEVELFGENFSTPIMTAALSHLHNICDNAMTEIAKGASDAGALHWVGMGEDDEMEKIFSAAKTVRIIKPHADNKDVLRRIEHAVKNGAFAVGMDIDHAISWDGKYDVVCGMPMRPKTQADMALFVKAAGKLPFIAKGVLSVSDALKCVEAGVSGIVVSHHHGIMDYAAPPLMVLPDIVKAVDGRMKIFVDCGVESGMDVFKALALGADAVCVGRELMEPLKDGSSGVMGRIREMNRELVKVMARTGFKNVKDIDSGVIRERRF
ncbi:MAG: alpha-hydroxy-acid oxidizing protein [Oscillospiraceae bacterium]|nr:alpha-hydroxy-acid oxidizing protein [Oscillospiraceae bacterium]